MYTILSQLFLSQYSRQLLSILAQQYSKGNKKKEVIVICVISLFPLEFNSHVSTPFLNKKNYHALMINIHINVLHS